MGELTDKIKGNANEAAGEIKQESNNPETRAEGRNQEVKGKAQQAKGEVKGKLGNDI
ncbi:CsbD family protein [Sphingomicrobium sp. XHP0239]|uniref:CsbD family protein n=1 Tax=Sphingomicrobium maritimum TaxID=3133972 RepID=UPI0031CC3CDD